MDLSEFASQVETFLPAYLSAADYRDVVEELRKYPDTRNLYWYWQELGNLSDPLPLQGDCWSGIPIRDYESGKKKHVKAIILSNSCDISSSNTDWEDRNAILSPIMRLDAYQKEVAELKGTERADSVSSAIRKQELSRVMYFPPHGIEDEFIALLDDIYMVPLRDFYHSKDTCFFRLNNAGFFVFLLKLSIHFTRMQENVARSGDPTV